MSFKYVINEKIVNVIFYIFHTKSSKPSVDFTSITHVSSDWPHFKGSTATWVNGTMLNTASMSSTVRSPKSGILGKLHNVCLSFPMITPSSFRLVMGIK